VQPYLERDYVAELPIGSRGLRASLHAATTREAAGQAFMREFIETVRITATRQFEGIRLLKAGD
jgi:LysR family transcriptional regulator, regulator for metE and metH